MYQVVVTRHLEGRGIFCTESRNEPNMALTPTPNKGLVERPVILGRKLAAKERRSLLEVRNSSRLLQDMFNGKECHVSPTARGEGEIAGPCMECAVCFTHGGLRSGGGASYGRAGIAIYDDAFCVEEGTTEVLTLNAVDTRAQRTGQALATETFIYGGSFLNVITLKHDAPEILNLVLDSIMSTNSYGARSRHYGRMKNEISAIVDTERPVITSFSMAGRLAGAGREEINQAVMGTLRGTSAKLRDIPALPSRAEVMMKAQEHQSVQAWIKEVKGYLGEGKGKKQ